MNRTKEKKITNKRQEQNRIAQKTFRQKKQLELREMQERLAEINVLKTELEFFKNQMPKLQCELELLKEENLQLLKERNDMIHTMDRLRGDNQLLKQQISKRKPEELKIVTSSKKPAFVKGAMTLGVYRPPFKSESKPMFVGHDNVFCEDPASTPHSTQSESGSDKQIVPTEKSSNNEPPVRKKLVDMNYLPKWTPPVEKANPNFHCYHDSFSYADSVENHCTFQKLDYSMQNAIPCHSSIQIIGSPISMDTPGHLFAIDPKDGTSDLDYSQLGAIDSLSFDMQFNN